MINQVVEILKQPKRLLLLTLSIAGLALIYLLQESLTLSSLVNTKFPANAEFVFKKLIRVTLNDLCMLLFLYAWFNNRSIIKLGLWVQAADTFILLPIYLLIKLSLEGTSEISTPLLSQWHRLIVNPTLMLLLIPAIYYQRFKESSGTKNE
jgi:exosortase F-associated protein